MNSDIKTPSTSIGTNVGIGNMEEKKKEYQDNEYEEDTIENSAGKVITPFEMASEHTVIPGGMHSGGTPPTAFITPRKVDGKITESLFDNEDDEFDDAFMSDDEIEKALAKTDAKSIGKKVIEEK
jgi:hypothetical protein